ncbi:hypothetical protein GH157_06430 [archaeon]|nr:hypothetical protein [archaeon]
MSALRGGQTRATLLILILGAVSIGAYRILLTQPATEGDNLWAHVNDGLGESSSPADAVRVVDIQLNSSLVTPGEPVGVLIGLENSHDQPVDYTLSLWVSGELEDEKEVSLDEGGGIEVDFTVRRSDQGSYEVRAANLSRTFEVYTADLFVVGLGVDPTSVGPGEPVTISVTVFNPNSVDLTQDLIVSIGGVLHGDVGNRGLLGRLRWQCIMGLLGGLLRGDIIRLRDVPGENLKFLDQKARVVPL